MENLKIRVNSEAEAEEVKRLAVKSGYKIDALFSKWSSEFCYLILCEDMSAGFGNEIMADGDKPLSIGELRAMAEPKMKEYLEKHPDGTYSLVLRGDACKESDIEVPEGAECLTKCKDHNDDEWLLFWKGDYKFCVSHDKEWFHFESDVNKYLDDWRGLANIIWQREQDEPFLTPESTLNDQYAEIEEVRQSIIKVNHNPNQQPREIQKNSIEGTLSERQTQYGCYEDVAQVTQQILSALRIGNYDKLPAPMKESLHMIASKMARIVNGDPEYFDNWHDIGGYAKLIEKLIKGE